MPGSSKSEIIDDGYWLRTHAVRHGIPVDCLPAYRFLFNQGVKHFKGIIDAVVGANDRKIQLPMQPMYLEKYLSGYSFEYRVLPYLGAYDECTEGLWRFDAQDPSCVIIFYKRHVFAQRQRYSQVHELLHFMQTVDPPFLDFLDGLIMNTVLPESVVVKLLHRITERATAMFLMPNDYFLKKYQEIRCQSSVFGEAQMRQLASVFDISLQAARFRLDECLREQPALRRLGFMPT